MPVDYGDLSLAVDFVGSGDRGQAAWVDRESGQVWLRPADTGLLDEPLPDDLEDAKRYVRVPGQRELNVGLKRLALLFTQEQLPDEFDRVEDFFSRAGAFGRFRQLLARAGREQQWQHYQNAAETRAVLEWAREEGLEVTGVPQVAPPEPPATPAITFGRITPILRIFDEAKAREFYLDFLGFRVDWEHRFERDLPLYLQVSRGGCVLHLSEHHGDGSPGVAVRIEVGDIDGLHAELSARKYRYARPGIEDTAWGTRELSVRDPFGNRLVFFAR
jgi:uncharacterized glyoxalase superfamily protein PhnB